VCGTSTRLSRVEAAKAHLPVAFQRDGKQWWVDEQYARQITRSDTIQFDKVAEFA
jgi:hypothetical protein